MLQLDSNSVVVGVLNCHPIAGYPNWSGACRPPLNV